MVVVVTAVVPMAIVTGMLALLRRMVLMLWVDLGRMVGVIGRRFVTHHRNGVHIEGNGRAIEVTLSQDYKGGSWISIPGRSSFLVEPGVFFVPEGPSYRWLGWGINRGTCDA